MLPEKMILAGMPLAERLLAEQAEMGMFKVVRIYSKASFFTLAKASLT